jgi:hypothetical protein
MLLQIMKISFIWIAGGRECIEIITEMWGTALISIELCFRTLELPSPSGVTENVWSMLPEDQACQKTMQGMETWYMFLLPVEHRLEYLLPLVLVQSTYNDVCQATLCAHDKVLVSLLARPL